MHFSFILKAQFNKGECMKEQNDYISKWQYDST